MREWTITQREAGQRLDRYLARKLPQAPKGFFYRMLRKKNIVLNGGKAAGSEVLVAGDTVRLWLAEETIAKFAGEEGHHALQPASASYPVTDLDILYEDPHVMLVNKPAGMLSQRAKPDDVSLCEYLIGYLLASGQMREEELHTVRPSVCNRLDRNTSGIVCCGKTSAGLAALSALLRERDVRKFYLAWVMGQVTGEQRLEGWLLKDQEANRSRILPAAAPSQAGAQTAQTGERRKAAKEVCTLVRPLRQRSIKGREMTLVEAQLVTGRSHQIRAQLAAAGHPLVGDVKYASARDTAFFRNKLHQTSQLLHCQRMEFPQLTGTLAGLSGRIVTAPAAWRF